MPPLCPRNSGGGGQWSLCPQLQNRVLCLWPHLPSLWPCDLLLLTLFIHIWCQKFGINRSDLSRGMTKQQSDRWIQSLPTVHYISVSGQVNLCNKIPQLAAQSSGVLCCRSNESMISVLVNTARRTLRRINWSSSTSSSSHATISLLSSPSPRCVCCCCCCWCCCWWWWWCSHICTA